jgi:xanthine dehydrogenase YagR molybdenum-binding subunit
MSASIGRPIDRVDGRLKVTGAARYVTDQPLTVTQAVLLTSTIARGRIVSMDTRAARGVRGVLAILTHRNTPKLPGATSKSPGSASRALQLLQDDVVRYANQPIGVVVADTLEAAYEGAERVLIRYAAEPPDVTGARESDRAYTPDWAAQPDQNPDSSRGETGRALSTASLRLDQVYTTPFETHNPMEPHATIAFWERPGRLILFDATQGIFGCRKRVAEVLGLRPDDVRVISPYLGGGFGSKGPTWSHVVLAALASQRVGRPVELALTRPQMFGPIGWRSATRQAVSLGATSAGALIALRHDTVAQTSSFDEFMEPAGMPARMLYACANNATTHKLIRTDIGTPSYMRAPGWAPGTFALECAIDEMAAAARRDPLAMRLTNYAERDPETGHAWSSNRLRDCYRLGAQRFGWERRPLEPGSLRDGAVRIGWGMATAVYPTHRSAASARAQLRPDGTLVIDSGTQDLGTGTYTVMTQIAADALGLPPDRVTFRLGDTRMPETPVSGGSQTAASVGSAVHLAVTALRDKLVRLAATDDASPVFGASDVHIDDGRLFARDGPARSETIAAFMLRRGDQSITAQADAGPGGETEQYAMYAFGAEFAEVRVDADLGQIRVSRMVGVFDIGRALNAKTARSQLIGGMVWGIGMALYEQTVFDERLGRVVNNNLAEYHIPVHADIPDLDVTWIDHADLRANPLGVKGIGELGITGACPAVVNAVYHATGRRVRDLPVTLDKLL